MENHHQKEFTDSWQWDSFQFVLSVKLETKKLLAADAFQVRKNGDLRETSPLAADANPILTRPDNPRSIWGLYLIPFLNGFWRQTKFALIQKWLFLLWRWRYLWQINSFLRYFYAARTRMSFAVIFTFLSSLLIWVSKTTNITEKNCFVSNLFLRDQPCKPFDEPL